MSTQKISTNFILYKYNGNVYRIECDPIRPNLDPKECDSSDFLTEHEKNALKDTMSTLPTTLTAPPPQPLKAETAFSFSAIHTSFFGSQTPMVEYTNSSRTSTPNPKDFNECTLTQSSHEKKYGEHIVTIK